MRIRVDADRCVGHGRCYELAPELFQEDEAGHCIVVHATVPHELEGAARLGQANCPERAILVESD